MGINFTKPLSNNCTSCCDEQTVATHRLNVNEEQDEVTRILQFHQNPKSNNSTLSSIFIENRPSNQLNNINNQNTNYEFSDQRNSDYIQKYNQVNSRNNIINLNSRENTVNPRLNALNQHSDNTDSLEKKQNDQKMLDTADLKNFLNNVNTKNNQQKSRHFTSSNRSENSHARPRQDSKIEFDATDTVENLSIPNDNFSPSDQINDFSDEKSKKSIDYNVRKNKLVKPKETKVDNFGRLSDMVYTLQLENNKNGKAQSIVFQKNERLFIIQTNNLSSLNSIIYSHNMMLKYDIDTSCFNHLFMNGDMFTNFDFQFSSDNGILYLYNIIQQNQTGHIIISKLDINQIDNKNKKLKFEIITYYEDQYVINSKIIEFNNNIYRFGGRKLDQSYPNTIDELQMNTINVLNSNKSIQPSTVSIWKAISSIDKGREFHVFNKLNENHILVAFGFNLSGKKAQSDQTTQTLLNDMQILNISTMVKFQVLNEKFVRVDSASSFYLDDKLQILGGRTKGIMCVINGDQIGDYTERSRNSNEGKDIVYFQQESSQFSYTNKPIIKINNEILVFNANIIRFNIQ